jgi:hypothetical protein
MVQRLPPQPTHIMLLSPLTPPTPSCTAGVQHLLHHSEAARAWGHGCAAVRGRRGRRQWRAGPAAHCDPGPGAQQEGGKGADEALQVGSSVSVVVYMSDEEGVAELCQRLLQLCSAMCVVCHAAPACMMVCVGEHASFTHAALTAVCCCSSAASPAGTLCCCSS